MKSGSDVQLHFAAESGAGGSSLANDSRDGGRALLLQRFHFIRSEHVLMESPDHALRFRWFVGMEMGKAVRNPAVFSKSRERLLNEEIAEAFFQRVLAIAQPYLPDEHFTLHGTLNQSWPSLKSFRPKDEAANKLSAEGGSNPSVNFRGAWRSKQNAPLDDRPRGATEHEAAPGMAK